MTNLLQQMKLQNDEMRRLNQVMYVDTSSLTQEVEAKIEEHLQTIQMLLYQVLNESFVVVEQPPQVLRRNNRFSATVHLMAGNVLNLPMDSPKVKVTIISEKQAAEIVNKDDWTRKEYSCAAKDGIINSEAHLTQSQDYSVVSCHFKNLQLKDFKREPRDSRSIHEQKFAILFSTEVKVGNDTWTLRTMSLPVIINVHGTQELQSRATILWDNGLSLSGRKPFQVDEEVSWQRLGEVLSRYWKAECGGELTEENLHFLACKALRNDNLSKHNFNEEIISWRLFAKDLLEGEQFTFWEWFFNCVKLTASKSEAEQRMQREQKQKVGSQLCQMWADGHVKGFIKEKDAESLLMQKEVGSFLLRYSDTELGKISIHFTKEREGEGKVLRKTSHGFERDLEICSIAQMIADRPGAGFDKLACLVGQSGVEVQKDALKTYLRTENSSNEVTNKTNIKHTQIMESTPAPVAPISSFSAAVFPLQLFQKVLKRLEDCEDAETKLLSSEFKQYIENNQPRGKNGTQKVLTNFRPEIEASPQPVAILEKPIPSPILMPAPAIPNIPATEKGQDKECQLNTAQVVALVDNFSDTPTAPVEPTEPTIQTATAVLSGGTAPAARPKLKVAKSTLKLNMAKANNSARLRSATIKPIFLEKHDTVGIASKEISSLSTPDISSADIKMELNSPFDFSGGPLSFFSNMIEEDSTDGPPPTKMVKHDQDGPKES